MLQEIKGFKFADFILDLEEQVLLMDGKPAALTPKAFGMLKVLVENHGRIVEKQRLMEAVWPDSYVEQGNLPYTVTLLRKTLGESKEQPRFIETVPRRGYRFIAPVTHIPFDKAEIEPKAEPTPAAPAAYGARPRGRTLGLAAAVAAVLFVGTGIWYGMTARARSSGPILTRPFSIEQLSTSGSSGIAAISPDGKHVIYSDEIGGRESLWLRNLDSSENVQIVPPSNDEYLGVTFSSGGRTVYFVRKADDVHSLPALYRIEMFGGVPVKLINNVNRRVSVSPDDTQIAFAQCRYRKTDFCSVVVADADGANERTLITTEGGVHIWDLRYSPDRRSIAVAAGRYLNDKNDSQLFEIDLQTGKQRDILDGRFYAISAIEWMPDGRGLLFSASDFRDGQARVYYTDRLTGKTESLTRDAGSYSTLNLDRSADKLIAVQRVPNYHINVVTGGNSTRLSVAREMTVQPGGRLVYSTFDGEIWSVMPDGTEQRQLTNTVFAEFAAQVSPDQKAIFFSSDESGKRQVWRMNADGSDRRQLTQTTGGFPLTVSADGRFLYYESTLDSFLFRVPVEGGGEELVHDSRLANAVMSPCGTHAAYLFTEAMVRKLAVMDLSTKENVRILEVGEGSRLGRQLKWSADGRSLHYVTLAEGKNSLWQFSPFTGAPAEKISDLGDGEILSISSAEDGSFVYISGKWRFDVMLLRGLE